MGAKQPLFASPEEAHAFWQRRWHIVYMAARLRTLAAEMDSVAVELSQRSQRKRWQKHSIELAGAAAMARDWAEGIEQEEREDGR